MMKISFSESKVSFSSQPSILPSLWEEKDILLAREEICIEKIYSLHILASKLNQKLSEASLSKMDDFSYLHLWKLYFTTFYEIDDSGNVNELMIMMQKKV